MRHQARALQLGGMRVHHDADGGLHRAGRVRPVLDRLHRAGRGGVHVRGDETAGLRNHVAAFHPVAGFDQRIRGAPDVLRQGQYDLLRERQPPRGDAGRQLLVFRRMHAVLEAGQ